MEPTTRKHTGELARAIERADLERQIALDDAVVLAFVVPLLLALWMVFS